MTLVQDAVERDAVEIPAPSPSGSPVPSPTTRTGLPEAEYQAAIARTTRARVNLIPETLRLACALAIHDRPLGELHQFPDHTIEIITNNLGRYDDCQLAYWQVRVPVQLWQCHWEDARRLLNMLLPNVLFVEHLPDFYEIDFMALHRRCHALAGSPGADCRCLR